MATTSVTTVGTEDLTSVRSRVCWGAIAAGTVVALGVQFVLTLLGAAIGFGILGNTQTDQIGVAALVWVIVSAAISQFAGGFGSRDAQAQQKSLLARRASKGQTTRACWPAALACTAG